MKGIRTFFHCRKGIYFNFDPGELAERSIAAVLKTVEVLQPPGVRIPNSPLHNLSYRYGGFFCVQKLVRLWSLREKLLKCYGIARSRIPNSPLHNLSYHHGGFFCGFTFH